MRLFLFESLYPLLVDWYQEYSQYSNLQFIKNYLSCICPNNIELKLDCTDDQYCQIVSLVDLIANKI